MDTIYHSMRLNETRKNLAANPERSPLMRSYGYASAGDRTAFADMDVGVRATQEQLPSLPDFPWFSFPSSNMQASGSGNTRAAG